MRQRSVRLCPQALIQGTHFQNTSDGYKRHGSQGNVTYDKKRDDVFFDKRLPENWRRDSTGFQFTRDQMRRMKYNNKIIESNYVRLFVYNIPNMYTVDGVYDLFSKIGIDVKDLWQNSHPDARRKSFVVKMPRGEVTYVVEDETLERMNIRVREYNERSD